jgi:hypothetical protein
MTARTRLADLMAQASPHLPLAISAALQAWHMAVCQEVDALREAAGKVTCFRCAGSGVAPPYPGSPCPDCAALRALLERKP